MTQAAFEKMRGDCFDALVFGVVRQGDEIPIIDDVFEIVTHAIRRRFNIGILEAELILRDARNEAEQLIDEYRFQDLVDVKDAVDTIARYLTEDDDGYSE